MSTASASTTIKFVRRVGTLTATLMTPNGDIYQEWEGTGSNPKCTPDFSNLSPKLILNMVCMSSRTSIPLTVSNVKWSLGGKGITFDPTSGKSTGNFSGVFQFGKVNGEFVSSSLTILSNIAKYTGGLSTTISAEGMVQVGNSVETIHAHYNVSIRPRTAASTRVTIISPSGDNFVITSKDPAQPGYKCYLKAVAMDADGTEVTTGLTYAWYKLKGGVWKPETSSTSHTLTVTENMVETFTQFKVVVKKGSNTFGIDIRGVMDISDPYVLDPNPSHVVLNSSGNEIVTPKMETIIEGSGAKIRYAPKIAARDTNVTQMPDAKFIFSPMDSVGNLLVALNEEGSQTFEVTEAMCVQSDGDVQLVIELKNTPT